MRSEILNFVQIIEQIQLEIDQLKNRVHKLESLSHAVPEDTTFDMNRAADYLHLPKGSLYNFTSQNRIKYHKVGRQTFFHKNDLDNFIEQNTHKTRKEIQIEMRTKQAMKRIWTPIFFHLL